MLKRSFLLLLAALAACVPPMPSQSPPEITIVETVTPSVIISDNDLTAKIFTDLSLSALDSLATIAQSPISWGDLIRIIHPELHDSSKAMATDYLTETFSNYLLIRSLVQLEKRNNSTIITYLVDTSAVLPLIVMLFEAHLNPIIPNSAIITPM